MECDLLNRTEVGVVAKDEDLGSNSIWVIPRWITQVISDFNTKRFSITFIDRSTSNTVIPELSATLTAIDLLDPEAYFIGAPKSSRRHKVRENLLGTARFSPVIRRTDRLKAFIERRLGEKANDIVGRTGANVVARAASFLLLADSRASFAIEGERPPRGRLERWGRAVVQGGRVPLTLEEIVRLHGVLIEDRRFIQPGLRTDGVFLG